REARLTASLDHPSIINIYEISEEPEDTYFTMKLVDGKSLAGALNNRTTRELLSIFLKICDGLSYAHSMSIVHLDLKPENILLGHFGETQIIDWGLGQRLNELENKIGRSGTPGFMAPEQSSKTAEIDHRADIFALGAILKFILQSHNSAQNLHEQTLKRRLSSVAIKAMSHSPKDRYQTVAALKNEINLFLDGYATIAENATYLQNYRFLYKRNKKVFKLAAVFLVTLAALTSYFLNSIQERKKEAKQAETTANKAQNKARIAEENAVKAKQIADQAMDTAQKAEVKATTASKRAAKEKNYASIMLVEVTKMIMDLSRVSDPETKKALQGILIKARKSNTQGNLSLLISIQKSFLKNNSDDKEAWALLGDLYISSYDFQRAADCYKNAHDEDSRAILANIKPLVDQGIDYQKTSQKIILKLFEYDNNSERWRSILYRILKLRAAILGVDSSYLQLLTLYIDRFAKEPQVIKYSLNGNRLSFELIKSLEPNIFMELSKLHIKYESFKFHQFSHQQFKANLSNFKSAISKIKTKTMDISQTLRLPLKGVLLNEYIKNIIINDKLNQENINKLKEKFKVYDTRGNQL
ncbi:MAG: protein kinase, partial [Lentisphaeraceae bacterium]|nr:protein kinase [Lentisphaeraceae bacterium]